MVTTAVMPLAADYSEAKTFTNEGYLRFTEIDDTESYVMSWDVATFEKATVNGEDYTIYPDISNRINNVSIFMIPNVGIIRFNTTGGGFASNQVVGLGALNVNAGFEISLNEGTYTITNDQNSTLTGSYTTAYCLDPEGEYVLKLPSENAFVTDNSKVFGMGVTNVLAWNNGFQVEGDNFQINGDVESIEVSTFSTGSASFSVTNVADDLTAVNHYENLYTINKITFTTTGTPVSGDPVTVNATYNYFLVPYKVTAEPDNPDTFKNMVRIVPLIALVALVAAAAGMIYFKGKE